MRTCRDCQTALVLGENWIDGQAKTQNYLCRSCGSLRYRAHYAAHAARKAERQRERLKNPEKAAKHAIQKASYYARNKERWAGYRKTQSQKERTIAWHRAGRMVTWTRSRAARMGVEHNISREWIEEKLSSGVCEVTGLPFELVENGGKRFHPWSPSIDRCDCTKGYTEDNCQMVVWIYNMAKSEFEHDDVVKLATALLAKAATEAS